MNSASVAVRIAQDEDAKAVESLITEAFGQPAEAKLVGALRKSQDAEIELVAETGGEIVGHILLSKLQTPQGCLALAPVSVLPEYQKRRIGSALIIEANQRAKAQGYAAIFVLGEPDYYTRFGFDVAAAGAFETEYPKEYFMVLELADGALEHLQRQVVYPAPFSGVD